MSRWQSNFEEHAIHSTLNQLEEWGGKEFDSDEEDIVSEQRRFLKVIDAYRVCLDKLDVELLPFAELDSLNVMLTQPNYQIWNQASAFYSSGNVSNLMSANNSLTKHLSKLGTLMSFSKKAHPNRPLQKLEETVDTYSKKFIAKSNDFSTEVERLETALDALDEKTSELSGVVDNHKEDTNGIISSWQEQFSSSQEKRTEEFSALRDRVSEDARQSLSELLKNSQADLAAHAKEYASQMSAYLADSDLKHKSILELYGLVAGDSVASAYLENANEEKGSADVWRQVSIAFICVTVVWLFAAFLMNNSAEFHWVRFLSSLSLTGTLLYGAVYSAQQSTRHRNNEKTTRRFALEIKAIDPFIASLESEEQSALKKSLSEKMFARPVDLDVPEKGVVNDEALSKILKAIADIIGKAKS